MFTFGGYDGESRLDIIEMYDSETKRWAVLDLRLPFALATSASACAISGTGSVEEITSRAFQALSN